MSPNSASKAEQLGYTNVKVYHDGLPAWSKKHPSVLTAASLKDAYIDKDIPHVLLDVRSSRASKKGSIKGAVTLPAKKVARSLDRFPAKDRKPPVIVYDADGSADARKAAQALIAAGYRKVSVLSGGFDAWRSAGYPVETGRPATEIVYVPKPRPGEIAIEEFTRIASGPTTDALILDVRNADEGRAGMLRNAVLIPDEEVLQRLDEIPKDTLVVTHCSTGVRAEMAYHKLKEKGYAVKFLNAKIEIDKEGNFTIERL